MAMTTTDAVKRIVSLYDKLKADKALQTSHWEDILAYTLPHLADVLQAPTGAESRYEEIYDISGQLGAAEFAANLYAEASPLSRRWFWLTAPAGSAMGRDRQYTESMADRTEQLHLAFQASNFDTEIHSVYESLTIGTGCILPSKGDKTPLSFSARPIREYCFTETEGRPAQVFVERRYTAVEAAEKFGVGELSDALQQSLRNLDDAAYTETSPYLNVHRPNHDFEPSAIGTDGYPYESLWIDRSNKDHLLDRRGMDRLQYVISRFWKTPGLPWGSGPSQMAYGPIRCLDKVAEIVLKYGAKAMDPASIWPHDGAFWPMSTEPGAILMGQMGAMDRGKPSYLELSADHRLGQFLFEYLGNQIARAYFAQVFQMLRDNKQRTAREVAVILEKDFRMAIPIFARLRAELYAPLIRNSLELMTEYELGIHGWRYGGQRLPEYDYDLELISPLGLSMRFAELQNVSDLQMLLSPWAELKPEIFDHYNIDEICRAFGDYLGIPKAWKRPRSEVRHIRELRAEAMAQRQALEQTQQAARAAKDLSGPVARDSVLAAVA